MDIQMMIKEYEPDISLFTEDDETMIILKQAVQALPPADKIIFLLYAEYGSLRQVGKELSVSHTTIYKQINLIKEQIKGWCEEHYPNTKIFK
jgi:transcriptional regulator of aromatic amino acid metabolism